MLIEEENKKTEAKLSADKQTILMKEDERAKKEQKETREARYRKVRDLKSRIQKLIKKLNLSEREALVVSGLLAEKYIWDKKNVHDLFAEISDEEVLNIKKILEEIEGHGISKALIYTEFMKDIENTENAKDILKLWKSKRDKISKKFKELKNKNRKKDENEQIFSAKELEYLALLHHERISKILSSKNISINDVLAGSIVIPGIVVTTIGNGNEKSAKRRILAWQNEEAMRKYTEEALENGVLENDRDEKNHQIEQDVQESIEKTIKNKIE